ncbi:MAG: hypothetical protein IT236_13335 [Bacteroidia bacterium]|nr:hypothetical protein [Bacteroidia bacterium]
MIKYLFILFNSFAVFIIGLFSGDSGIKLSTDMPATVNVGKEITVEFKVSKGELSGFGRLVINVPEGFSVTHVDEKDAEYTFEENKAKWVWAALPADQDLVIKVTMVAQESALGEHEFNAKFSYVENNEKQFVDLSPAKITVLAANTAPGTETASTPAKPDSSAVPQTTSNAEPPGNLVVERSSVWVAAEKAFHISIKIKKGNTKGFARYSDDTHDNLNAKSLKTDGSSFSIADGKIKFVWVNVPDKDLLEVAYTLTGKPLKPVVLNGEYSYLEDNQSKKVLLKADTLNFINTQIEPPLKELPPKETVKEVKKEEQSTETKKEEVVKTNEVVTPQKSEADASFQVQVGAFTNGNISSNALKTKFNITENIRSEMAGGFVKFMAGSHNEYKKAKDHREILKNNNGVKSAFVVAYNNGKRITVQEALMVTNQKWVK